MLNRHFRLNKYVPPYCCFTLSFLEYRGSQISLRQQTLLIIEILWQNFADKDTQTKILPRFFSLLFMMAASQWIACRIASSSVLLSEYFMLQLVAKLELAKENILNKMIGYKY